MSPFNFNNVIEWDALSETEREEILRRPAVMAGDRIRTVVESILESVRERGDEALREFSAKFDRTEVKNFKVSAEEVDAAIARLPEDFMSALKTAAANIEKFHSAEVLEPVTVETMPGVRCQQVTRSIGAVGLYIPGGTAPLFSTVLMLGIPAKIAGCGRVILCSPPPIADPILAAARSEVLVIADEGAEPSFVAADLLSQAEHGPDSQVVLLTPSRILAEAVAKAAAEQLAELPRREIATKALSASRLILVKNLEECVKVSNRYAPEHLIIQTRNASELVPLVQNAGSVFVGDWSPESGGDYATGTNHVLPTYGYAATCSSLGLADFTKRMTVQEMTPQGFEKLGPAIALLAHAEELDAHMNAVLVRMAKIKQSKE